MRNSDAWKGVESGEGWEPSVSYERCSVQETETIGEVQQGWGKCGGAIDRQALENRGTDEGIKEKHGGAGMDD